MGANYEQLLSAFFSCFWGKHYSVLTNKLHNKSFFFICFKFFLEYNCFFFGLRTFSNVNVPHKDILLQDSAFRLEKAMCVSTFWADRSMFGRSEIFVGKTKVCYFWGWFFHVFMDKKNEIQSFCTWYMGASTIKCCLQ